jgi:mannobiose 2-epimerase
MKEVIIQHLNTVIVPFWTALYDVEHGGFYGHVDSDHVVDKTAAKGLVQQARHLYAFSRLYRTFRDERLLRLIDGTYDFLRKHFYLPSAQRYAWLVQPDGQPIDRRIVTYGQAFVIYALSEYAMARPHPEALKEALRLFRCVEADHVDPLTGGYLEEFDAFMKPRAARQLADGHEGVKFTANTHLHLLEAVTNLVKASGDAMAKRSLQHLIHLLRDKHYHPERSSLAMYCDEAFGCFEAPRSFGHDIEAAWLIRDAAKQLRLPDEQILPMVADLAQGVLEDGFNGDYVRYEQNGEDLDGTMVWWVQCEAMVGFLDAYQHTGDERYKIAAMRTYETVMERLVDKRPGGEWFWSVSADGTVETKRGMAELWKTTYHNVRALLEMIERL